MQRSPSKPSPKKDFLTHALVVAVLALTFACQGCGNILAKYDIPRSGINLSEALTKTTNEQLLLRIVSDRYVRAKSLLSVSSITSQMRVEAGLGGQVGPKGGSFITPGVSFSDQPTITYTPVTGSEFVNQWLTPISLQTLMVMIVGGWDVVNVLKIVVQQIGSLPNGYTGSLQEYRDPPKYEKFYRAVQLLATLHKYGVWTISIMADNNFPVKAWVLKGRGTGAESRNQAVVLPDKVIENIYQSADSPVVLNFSREILDESSPAHVLATEFFELLGLDMGSLKPTNANYPNTLSLILQNAMAPAYAENLKVRTRSMQQIIYAMSWAVDVPAEAVKKGWVWKVPTTSGVEPFDFRKMFDELLHVRCSDDPSPPDEAAISVKYDGNHYYIARDDLYSKRSFLMLLQLSILQSGIQNSAVAPTLTLGLQ